MIAEIHFPKQKVKIDLSKPIDVSILLSPNGPRAWYVERMVIAPVINQFFAGSVKLGGSVNFRNVAFNPHGHGTHTETVGHIEKENHYIGSFVPDVFSLAKLITVELDTLQEDTAFGKKGDKYISKAQVEKLIGSDFPETLVVRTLPNEHSKLTANYSSTNFPYFEPEALGLLAANGVKHLATDTPSVDREEDGGKLLAHRAFWYTVEGTRGQCTITEMIFVPNEVKDGNYALQLHTARIANDASPSRVLLFEIQ
jgi:kynurenine formamidase